MNVGERHEREGNVEEARAAYAQAVSAASAWEPARMALDRVEAELAHSEYKRRIAQTVTALARNDLTLKMRILNVFEHPALGTPAFQGARRKIETLYRRAGFDSTITADEVIQSLTALRTELLARTNVREH